MNEMFKLTNVGLNPDLFKFGNLTLESEKYICVKDGAVILSLFKNFVFFNRTASLLTQARASQQIESQ